MYSRCFQFVQCAILAAFPVLQSLHAQVVINEIHYVPDAKTEPAQFIELHNPGFAEVTLAGWTFTSGIGYTFPENTAIAPGGYVVIAQNPAFLQSRFDAMALGPWTGHLSRGGEKITLRDSQGTIQQEVDYQLGFPWPTAGGASSPSIELLHPLVDNDLGGSWRASLVDATSGGGDVILPANSVWRFLKGQGEPSTPSDQWRRINFDDSSWLAGTAPIGYGEAFITTVLADMRTNYTSVFFRRSFVVPDPAKIGSLFLEARFDDGFKVWLNGVHLLDRNMAGGNVAYNGFSIAVREDTNFEGTVIPAAGLLVRGTNLIAVQAHNSSLSSSSDFFFDLRLRAEALVSPGKGPTPGRQNSVYTERVPPQIRQVKHSPTQPHSEDSVLISAKITALSGIGDVKLRYQMVDPGNYIELNDPAYQSGWVALAMNDQGIAGDAAARDDLYTVTVPKEVQRHRRLVRYRIEARDGAGQVIQVPYLDDPQPNFAYFVYDGIPAWQGAIRPGTTPAVEYGSAVMNALPVYHLISKKNSVEQATWYQKYQGSDYPWTGTLVYDGDVYDHVQYRARGGVWRYAMGKNMWKFDFPRGHDFQARDNYGKQYEVKWKKLNLGACIQQADFLHRGEQGMFEAVGFRLFNLVGVESPRTHWIQFRIIDEALEANPTNQYQSDLWGLYLAVEQEDNRFLDEHDLPDGNLYKMEGGTGDLNNLGPGGPSDKSDLNQFLGTYSGPPPSDQWWRTNLDLPRYYSYRTIVEAIRHFDIGDGKNYFYYLNPETSKWSVHPWDLDLTWADNMYGDGNEPFKSRVLASSRTQLLIEYKNRIREIRDLLFNTDQAYQLIDEYAAIIDDPAGGPAMVDLDRALWDYHPVMANSGIVNSGKAGQGRFYQRPPTKDFSGMVQLMKNYVRTRGTVLDNLSRDPLIPARPTITYAGPADFPANRLAFRCSAFNGVGSFAALEWRMGEVTETNSPTFNPLSKRKYEMDALWHLPNVTSGDLEIAVPPARVETGATYRIRARMLDSTGRASNWSHPVEFKAGASDNAHLLAEHLRLSELMYHPVAGSDYEYIELHNDSVQEALDLGGLKFTQGIDYIFAPGVTLGPEEYLLLVRGTNFDNFASFRAYYALGPETKIIGPYAGSLKDEGEELRLEGTSPGSPIFSFKYGNSRGWPIAADGAGPSLVPQPSAISGQGTGALNYAANWRASSALRGSPGRADPIFFDSILINELFAGAGAESWVEFYNRSSQIIELNDWFLSDDPADLTKWGLAGLTIPPSGWTSFNGLLEGPGAQDFHLERAGGELFFSYLPLGGQGRIVDSLRFKGQDGFFSWGRNPDGNGFWEALEPTREGPNRPGAARPITINEVMYHPRPRETQAGDNELDEYIELFNPGTNPVSFSAAAGDWRLDGAIEFVFPPDITLQAGEYLLVVNFNPRDAALLAAFKKEYHLEDIRFQILGPSLGKLPNSSGRVALERPVATQTLGSATGWFIVDEVLYSDQAPWPTLPDGTGFSLNRATRSGPASDPAHWIEVLGSPGQIHETEMSADQDRDGLPDRWEAAKGLDPRNPTDAASDPDSDGQNNFTEFLAGTEPHNSQSRFKLQIISTLNSNVLSLRFPVWVERSYLIQSRDSFGQEGWSALSEVAPVVSGLFDFAPDRPMDKRQTFYRVIPQLK